jgi:sulfonate transport system permease protein
MSRLRRVALTLALPVVLLVAWWFGSADSTSVYLPPLSQIWSALWTDLAHGPLLGDLGLSLENLAIGYAVAVVVGVTIGAGLGLSPQLSRLLHPYVEYARSLPQVAFVPLIVGALGIGPAPKVLSIALGCVFPILLNATDGVRSVPAGYLAMARSHRTPLWTRLRLVVLPAALPQIFSGMRVALGVGVVVMVVSEIYGSTHGLGYYILSSEQTFASAQTWAGTILLGVVGYLLSQLLRLSERRVLRWHYASRAAT